jgi:2-dehydro-3-deoxyphosphogalactonate aldolase
MNAFEDFRRYLGECPLVGIIRGVRPDEAEAIGEAIWGAGIRIIEVPLNSPEPLESIRRLSASLGDRALVGAGTVLDPAYVDLVKAAGGRLIVSPNTNPQVITATVSAEMASCPGFFTPSEALAALNAGAHALKLFPAEAATPAVLKGQRAVLPKDVPILVVGGIRPDNMQPWLDSGADGFGLGGSLYTAGRSAEETRQIARAFVEGVRG